MTGDVSRPIMDDCFDEKACLAAVREGDQKAAEALVTHLYPQVIKVVRARLPRMMAEEDMAQDVFAKVFQKLDQYQGATPLTHWVSRVALTTCFDALRRQQRRPEIRLSDLSEQEEAVIRDLENDRGTEAELDGSAAAEVVDKLLAALAPEDAAVIRWLEIEDKTVREIQALTGWSAALVKVRAFRARRKLRKIYDKNLTKEAL
nr:sigma-70 family RNA polymerase sigma factor [Oscillatoria laete-virens]